MARYPKSGAFEILAIVASIGCSATSPSEPSDADASWTSDASSEPPIYADRADSQQIEEPDATIGEPDGPIEEPDSPRGGPDAGSDVPLDARDATANDDAEAKDGFPSDQRDSSPRPGWAPLPPAGPGLPPLISWFAEAPSDPNIVLAGFGRFKHYHYRSTDGGATWTPLPPITPPLWVPVFAPSDANIAYAYQYDHLGRSNDGGRTWLPRSAQPALDRLTVDPRDPDKLYGVRQDTLFISNNGGSTWTESTMTTQAGDGGVFGDGQVFLMPDDPSRIYVASSGSLYLLLVSKDGGVSWDTLRSVPRGQSGNRTTFAIAPSDANVFYHFGTQLCRSANRGTTWSCHEPPWAQADYGTLLGVDANDPNVVYVGQRGLDEMPIAYRSADGGASWKGLIEYGERFNGSVESLLVSRRIGGRIVASNATPSSSHRGVAQLEGISRSDDGGATFARVGQNLREFPTLGFVTARNDDRILIQWAKSAWEEEDVTATGYSTSTRGAQWQKLDWTFEPDAGLDPQRLRLLNVSIGSVIEHPTDPESAFVRAKGVTVKARSNGTLDATYPSNDGLISTSGDASLLTLGNCTIGVDDPAVRYCCAGGTFARTTDGGRHWTVLGAPTSCRRPWVDVASSAVVYVVTNQLPKGRVLRSDDRGEHFVDITPPDAIASCGPNCYSVVEDITLDESDPTRVFARSGTAEWLVSTYYESRDRGATWTRLPGLFPKQLVYTDPHDVNVLYAAGQGGVRKSRDRGQTWFAVASGLEGYDVCKLRLSKQTPGLAYALTCDDRRINDELEYGPGNGPLYWTTTGGE